MTFLQHNGGRPLLTTRAERAARRLVLVIRGDAPIVIRSPNVTAGIPWTGSGTSRHAYRGFITRRGHGQAVLVLEPILWVHKRSSCGAETTAAKHRDRCVVAGADHGAHAAHVVRPQPGDERIDHFAREAVTTMDIPDVVADLHQPLGRWRCMATDSSHVVALRRRCHPQQEGGLSLIAQALDLVCAVRQDAQVVRRPRPAVGKTPSPESRQDLTCGQGAQPEAPRLCPCPYGLAPSQVRRPERRISTTIPVVITSIVSLSKRRLDRAGPT